MEWSYIFGKRPNEKGQGLVEYALMLVMVAVVVIAVLLTLGPQVGQVFSKVMTELQKTGVVEAGDTVVITKSNYNPSQKLHLDATSDGSFQPGVTLTASPGGLMEAKSDHYHLNYDLTGCPCTVTVTSSSGGSATVTVGP